MALWDRESDRDLEIHRLAVWGSAVTVRMATPADAAALRRLAGLDSRPLPPRPHLVVERDGRVDAAISLSTHQLIADPFRRTAELARLLRCHAGRLGSTPRPVSPPCPQLRPEPAT